MPISSVSTLNRGLARYGLTARSGITMPKRTNPQFIFSRSYGSSIHGMLSFWDSEALAGRWREFWLDSMYINDQLVISTNELLVNASTSYTYRDDGFGLSISDYADAMNTKLAAYNLKSRFYPGDGYQGSTGIVAFINPEEEFEFNFYDISTDGTPGLDPIGYFKLKAVQGRIMEGVVFSPGVPPIQNGVLYSLDLNDNIFKAGHKIISNPPSDSYEKYNSWPYP